MGAARPFPWKQLWYLARTVAEGIVYQRFDTGDPIFPTGVLEEGEETTVWMHTQVIYEDTVSQDIADDQLFTLDILNYTNDLIDNTWVQSDFGAMDAHIGPYVTAMANEIASRYTAKEVRYYPRSFNPLTDPKTFSDSGGPAWVSPLGVVSTGGPAMPPSVTTTVTEMTPSRKNWGRWYTPTLGTAAIASTGRLNAANMASILSKSGGLVEGLWDDGYKVVVPTSSVGGRKNIALEGDFEPNPTRTLQAVTGLRIDDVVDSHRSRRHKKPITRQSFPV